jgi:hypothetical protein
MLRFIMIGHWPNYSVTFELRNTSCIAGPAHMPHIELEQAGHYGHSEDQGSCPCRNRRLTVTSLNPLLALASSVSDGTRTQQSDRHSCKVHLLRSHHDQGYILA